MFTFEEIEDHLIKTKGDGGYEEDFFRSAVDKLGRDKFVKFTLEFTMKAMVRDHDLKKYMEKHMETVMNDEEGCSALDLISVTDHAFAFFQYLNNVEKWTKRYEHREDPGHAAHKAKDGRYSKNKGRAKYLDGISDEGMTVYTTLVSFFDEAAKTTDWKEIKAEFDVEFYKSSMCIGRRIRGVKKALPTMDRNETSTLEVPRLPPLNDLFGSGLVTAGDSEEEGLGDYDEEGDYDDVESEEEGGGESDMRGDE